MGEKLYSEALCSQNLRWIPVDQLRPGMFVHDLGAGWFQHSIWRRRFLLKDEYEIDKIKQDSRIRTVAIDITKGVDVDPAVRTSGRDALLKVYAGSEDKYHEAVRKRAERLRSSVPLDEERRRAALFLREGLRLIDRLSSDFRLDKTVDVQYVEPFVEKIIDSVTCHRDALIPMLQIKKTDQYDYQHSISSAALSAALGRVLSLEDDTLHSLVLGVLLQDIGMLEVPGTILRKRSALTMAEMRVVQRHVDSSLRMLSNITGIHDTALEVVANHHERFDGSGYPRGIAGDDIPIHGQIAALVDAYDAMVSDRPPRRRIEPTEALQRIYHMGGKWFDEKLVAAFIRMLGIYPAGSLVRLSNGMLAVVITTNQEVATKPVVKVVYDSKHRCPILPYLLDLAGRMSPPSIVGAESFADWGIDPSICIARPG